MFSLYEYPFDFGSFGQTHVYTICQDVSDKRYFSIHIALSSIKFTWFAFRNHQNSMTDLCSILENYFICYHFE